MIQIKQNLIRIALTNDEFAAQCFVFFLAGYDTTNTTISFAIYNLACNPEAQDKLYEEAKTILESDVSQNILYKLKISFSYLY
jgi:cytochrome P450